jgi:radical SAM protein with 4Fe4S-binding SPASM domain
VTARLFHFAREVDGAPARYHLRVDPDGSGFLLANASAALRLSETGVIIAQGLLEGASPGRISKDLARRFAYVDRSRAARDVTSVRTAIDDLTRPRDGVALTSLDDPGATVHRRAMTAPLSAEVMAPASGAHGRAIVGALWKAAIPQVRFVLPVGEKPMHLTSLVEAAEDLGMIAGVRARASDLVPDEHVRDLANAGLDHLDLLWAGVDPKLHADLFGEGDLAHADRIFALCRELELFPIAVVPLLSAILDDLDDLGAALGKRQITAMIGYAIAEERGEGRTLSARELPQVATSLEEVVEHFGVNLIWAAPEQRDPSASLAEQVSRGPRAAGEACVRVDDNGQIYAPTGPLTPAGNILLDAWDDIWARPVFESWRESVDDPPRCAACPGLALCAGGCPRDRATWAALVEGAQ